MSSITGAGTSHIYYNITLTNNDTSESGVYPPVSFTETRNTPFIDCPEDYNMSVVRFSLETPTLPVIVCQPVVGSNDNQNLIYQVRLGWKPYDGVFTYQETIVQFVPSTNLVPAPSTPITLQDIENPYYNLYSYNAFILLINDAIERAYNAYPLNTFPAGSTTPFLSWDTGGNLAILSILQNLVSDTAGNGTLTVAFNPALFTLFSSFNSYKYKDTLTDNIWYQLIVDNGPSAITSSSVVTVAGATTTIYTYQVIQEYTTCPLWTPIDSIVFTTSMIPINPELVAAPVVYNNNQVFQSVGTNANLTNVLTDFIVPLTTGTEYKPSINYTPSAEYRLVSMFGTSPCSSIQVNVYYKNRFGTLVPLTLGFGSSASIKILFRRKDFGNIIVN